MIYEINLKDRAFTGLDGKPRVNRSIIDGRMVEETELIGQVAGDHIAMSSDPDYHFVSDLGRKLYKCEAKTQLTPKEMDRARALIPASRLPGDYKSQIMAVLENAKQIPDGKSAKD